MRRRHKATRRHLKATRHLRIQAELCRIAAIGLVARHCGNAIGNLLLHHDDGALERGHRLEELQDDCRRHVIGQVRDKYRGLAAGGLLNLLRAHLKRVAHDKAEVGVVGGVSIEHRLELGICLNRRNARRLLQQGQRQRAATRADLEHALIARKLSELTDTFDHMVVDQEVLAQAMLGRKAKLLQQLPGGRGVCQRRSCHGCLLSMMAAS